MHHPGVPRPRQALARRPGVHVDELDLSGHTPDAAKAAIAHHYGSLGAGVMALAGPTGELTIGYGSIGRGPDTTAILDRALAAGRQGEPVADLIRAPRFDAWVTVSVYQNGKLIRRKTYSSHYATTTGVLLRGEGSVSKPDPTPWPSP